MGMPFKGGVMIQWDVFILRDFVVYDLNEFLPDNSFEGAPLGAQNLMTVGRKDYELGKKLYFSSPPGMSPRQKSAANLLMDIGLHMFTDGCVTHCEDIGDEAKRAEIERSGESLDDNVRHTLLKYILFVPDNEARPLQAILDRSYPSITTPTIEEQAILDRPDSGLTDPSDSSPWSFLPSGDDARENVIAYLRGAKLAIDQRPQECKYNGRLSAEAIAREALDLFTQWPFELGQAPGQRTLAKWIRIWLKNGGEDPTPAR